MKTPKQIEEVKSELSPSEVSDAGWTIKELEAFLDKKEVSLGGLKRLEAIEAALILLRRQYTARVIRLLKSNYMVD